MQIELRCQACERLMRLQPHDAGRFVLCECGCLTDCQPARPAARAVDEAVIRKRRRLDRAMLISGAVIILIVAFFAARSAVDIPPVPHPRAPLKAVVLKATPSASQPARDVSLPKDVPPAGKDGNKARSITR